MQEYRLSLVDDKFGAFRLLAFLLLFVNLIVFLMLAWAASASFWKILYGAGGLLSLASVLWGFSAKSSKKDFCRRTGLSLLFSSLLWFAALHWMPALSSVIMGFFSFRMSRGIVIIFSESGVHWPFFPSRFFNWHEISHVILKDRMLTVEYGRNRVLQSLISQESSDVVDEGSFNAFCMQCLKAEPPGP